MTNHEPGRYVGSCLPCRRRRRCRGNSSSSAGNPQESAIAPHAKKKSFTAAALSSAPAPPSGLLISINKNELFQRYTAAALPKRPGWCTCTTCCGGTVQID